MHPVLDVYVVSRHRDRESVERFISAWVDRASSEDRGDEELMLVPLGMTDIPDHFDGWEWEPARTISHIIQRGLDQPARAFAVYLKPTEPSLYEGVSLTFTTDGQMILGVSVYDSDSTDAGLARAKQILEVVARENDADAGYIVLDEAPPRTAANVPAAFRNILFAWSRGDEEPHVRY